MDLKLSVTDMLARLEEEIADLAARQCAPRGLVEAVDGTPACGDTPSGLRRAS
jgi:hypothetical protein